MFDEPEEKPEPHPIDPVQRAKEKTDELRVHAELVAVFEGIRKFDAQVRAGLDPQIARDAQKTMGKLDRMKVPDAPVINEEGMPQAASLLDVPTTHDLSTNDYHVYHRPGETM